MFKREDISELCADAIRILNASDGDVIAVSSPDLGAMALEPIDRDAWIPKERDRELNEETLR